MASIEPDPDPAFPKSFASGFDPRTVCHIFTKNSDFFLMRKKYEQM
jgi:hypothetical protein